MVVVDLASRPRFFVKVAMGPESWLRFYIGAIVDLAIGRVVLTGTNIDVGFSELFLW